MSSLFNTEGDLSQWLMAGALFFVLFSVFMAAQRLLWKRLEAWTAKSEAKWDDLLVEEVKRPLKVLLTIAAATISLQLAPAEIRGHTLLVYGPKIGLILMGAWIFERIAYVFFNSDALPDSFSGSTRTLFMTVFRFAFLSIVLLVVLDTVGISITPILASLGVGSVAVALALQETLSNFFSGIYILVDKPFKIGDFVNVDGGSEGTVESIGWRSTHIRLGNNNVVVFPNNKLAGSVVTNFDLPSRPTTVVVNVGVSYDCDLAKVEQVTFDEAKRVTDSVAGADRQFVPVVRFKEFADSSINLSVVLGVQYISETHILKHEFIKALHERYRRENISIPYPTRTVQLIKETP